jgi:hypothetical protein
MFVLAKPSTYFSDSYFRYLFILMKYGADVFRRRIRAKIFLFLQYDRVKLAVINDKKFNRLVIFAYYKKEEEKALFEYVGLIKIYGYFPKQVRKIIYHLQKDIRENKDGFRDKLKHKDKIISRSIAWNYRNKK